MCNKEDEYFKHVLSNYYFNKRLLRLGIETKYIAFYYLSDIMHKLINENHPPRGFSSNVYPALAEKYNKNDCTIERDIRNLINAKWDASLKNKLSQYWLCEYPPSCCQFIKIVQKYITDNL